MRQDDKQRQTSSGGLHLDLLSTAEKMDLKSGNTLISHLYTAVKAAQIYDENNEGFTSQVDSLMETIRSAFDSDDCITLEVFMHCLFYNSIKIKTEFQNYMHTKNIIEILKKRNAEGLVFLPELTSHELSMFVRLLSKRDDQEETTFEEFQDQLVESGIHNITVHKFSAATKRASDDRLRDIRRLAKRAFFESIYNLKSIMFKGKSERRIGIRRVQRLVQSIVDLIAEDESYLIGLTTMKNFDSFILNHSVNVCILSLAIGHRLGLKRDALKELGLAGLFHDLGKTPFTPTDTSDDTPPAWLDISSSREHPHRGVEKVMEMKSLGELPVRAMKAIFEHHLRFDLQGFPKIPDRSEQELFSRIIALADYFDVACTPRPSCPEPDTPTQVVLEIIQRSGTAFDPLLVKLFVNTIGLYPVGSLVKLSTGELGVTLRIHTDPEYLDRPTIKIIRDIKGIYTNGNGGTIDLSQPDPVSGTYNRSIISSLNPSKLKIDTFAIVAQ